MGLQGTFQTAAKQIVDAFGDVAVSTIYHSLASTSANTYNASSGVVAAVVATVGGVKVIFDVFTMRETDGVHIRSEDKKALVPQKYVSTITPVTGDRILVAGITWKVVNVKADPATALYELQVRRS
jgi:hypothetical protein